MCGVPVSLPPGLASGGPDGMLYTAWAAEGPRGPDRACFWALADGPRPPLGMKASLSVFMPNGGEDGEEVEPFRCVGTCRARALRSRGTKVIEVAVNRSLARSFAGGAHAAQHGFVGGRQSALSLIELDVEARCVAAASR